MLSRCAGVKEAGASASAAAEKAGDFLYGALSPGEPSDLA